jgi:hypothetical protein
MDFVIRAGSFFIGNGGQITSVESAILTSACARVGSPSTKATSGGLYIITAPVCMEVWTRSMHDTKIDTRKTNKVRAIWNYKEMESWQEAGSYFDPKSNHAGIRVAYGSRQTIKKVLFLHGIKLDGKPS